jgi:hypothetical protein
MNKNIIPLAPVNDDPHYRRIYAREIGAGATPDVARYRALDEAAIIYGATTRSGTLSKGACGKAATDDESPEPPRAA